MDSSVLVVVEAVVVSVLEVVVSSTISSSDEFDSVVL